MHVFASSLTACVHSTAALQLCHCCAHHALDMQPQGQTAAAAAAAAAGPLHPAVEHCGWLLRAADARARRTCRRRVHPGEMLLLLLLDQDSGVCKQQLQ
jgi:hypothetical protein